MTGRNVAAGLAGMYLIRDKYEKSLNLPSGKYEVPLIFQTISLNAQGNGLVYTTNLSNEFYGNMMTVNGKVAPYIIVEPRKYRSVLNANNARALQLKLVARPTAARRARRSSRSAPTRAFSRGPSCSMTEGPEHDSPQARLGRARRSHHRFLSIRREEFHPLQRLDHRARARDRHPCRRCSSRSARR